MAFLQGKVKIPGIGQVPKGAVAAGVGVVGVFAIIWWRKNHPAQGGTVTDPDGNVCAALNPATGFCPGTPGDLAASGFSAGQHPQEGPGGGGPGGGHGGPPFTTNAAWARYATAYLVDTLNHSAAKVGSALGSYLTGRAVDQIQEGLINEAIAYAGTPPVRGPQGYPPNIRIKGGKTGGKTYAANPVTGLKAEHVTDSAATLKWDHSPHATHYAVRIEEDRKTVLTEEVTSETLYVASLHPGLKYEVSVLARPARPSAHPAHLAFTTHPGGGSKVRVPHVVGREHRAAAAEIRAAGLRPRAEAGNLVSWIVGSQHPAAGTEVSKGSTVVLRPPSWHR